MFRGCICSQRRLSPVQTVPSNTLHQRTHGPDTVHHTTNAVADSHADTITNCKPNVKPDTSTNANVFAR